MQTLIALLIIGSATAVQAQDSRNFFSVLPECAVYKEKHCNEQSKFVGPRIDCYKRFLTKSSACKSKAHKYFENWEKDNRDYESRELSKIKAQASDVLEKNYEARSGQSLDVLSKKAVDSFEGSQYVREVLSYINRIIVPATKKLGAQYEALKVEAIKNETNTNELIQKAEALRAQLLRHEQNFEAYQQMYGSRIQGLRFEENRLSYQEILSSTRFLVQETFDLGQATEDIIAQLKAADQKSKANVVVKASKGEITLRKMRQLRAQLVSDKMVDQEALNKDIDFLKSICRQEFPDHQAICEADQETKF